MQLALMVVLNSLEPLATTAQSLDTWHATAKRVSALATIAASLATLVVTVPVLRLMKVSRGLARPATIVPSQDIWLVIVPKVIVYATSAKSQDISAVNALKAVWMLAVPVVPSVSSVARLATSRMSAQILLKILVTRSATRVARVDIYPRTAPRLVEMERDASSVRVLATSLVTVRNASHAASLVTWRVTAARLLHKHFYSHHYSISK